MKPIKTRILIFKCRNSSLESCFANELRVCCGIQMSRECAILTLILHHWNVPELKQQRNYKNSYITRELLSKSAYFGRSRQIYSHSLYQVFRIVIFFSPDRVPDCIRLLGKKIRFLPTEDIIVFGCSEVISYFPITGRMCILQQPTS